MLKLSAKNRSLNYEMFKAPIREDVSVEVMDSVLQSAIENENLNKDLNFVNLMSLLAVKYRGIWSEFKQKDLDNLIADFKKGFTEKDLAKEFENYPAFKKFYSAMFSEMVGSYSISKTKDKNGKPIYEPKFGIKNYFPIAYDFDASFVDDYEKENKQLSSFSHLGVDVAAKIKTPIVAVESGVVKSCSKSSDFGWQIVIESLDGLRTYYYANCYGAHPFVDGIMPKSIVFAGQVIAYVGATSCCSQKVVQAHNCPHLHFGFSVKPNKNADQQIWINPYNMLKMLQRHRSVVISGKDDDYENKYLFADPSLEAYLKKHGD